MGVWNLADATNSSAEEAKDVMVGSFLHRVSRIRPMEDGEQPLKIRRPFSCYSIIHLSYLFYD